MNINNIYDIESINTPRPKAINPCSLQELENKMASSMCEKIQHWIENHEADSPEPTTLCRDCGQAAFYDMQQVAYIRTQFGLISYKRAGYACSICSQTTFPLDERLNPIASLARLQVKISAGKLLPVSELAKAWRLGHMESPSW